LVVAYILLITVSIAIRAFVSLNTYTLTRYAIRIIAAANHILASSFVAR
jgi:hypothetical protein